MEDPFLLILKIPKKGIPNYKKYVDNQDLISHFDSHQLPSFSKKEIQLIESKLKSGKNHSEAIKQFDKVLIPFVPKPFCDVRDIIINDDATLDYLHQFILSSYVSWIIFYEHSQTIECLYDLLNMLLFLHNSQYSAVSRDCFLYVFKIYISLKDFSDFEQYFPQFMDFFQLYENLPEDRYSILSSLFTEISTLGYDNILYDIMENFHKIMKKHSEHIPADVYKSMTICSIPLISNMSDIGLHFYKLLITKLTPEQAKEIASTMILVICKEVISLNKIPDFPHFNEDYQTIESSFKIPKDFPKNPTFEAGFNISDTIPKFELPSLTSLQNKDLMEKITPLFEIFKLSKCSSIEAVEKMGEFMNRITTDQLIYNLYIVFLSLISLVLKYLLNSISFTKYLFRKEIFNPSITCFDKNYNNQEIMNLNILRTEAFKYILYDGADNTLIVLNSYMNTPIFFNEMIQRCIYNVDTITTHVLESKSFIDYISNALVFYQNLRYNGEKMADIISLNLFFLVSLICQDKRANDTLFDENYFCTAFVFQTFEESPRNFIYTQIRSSWQGSGLPHAFFQLLKSLIKQFPSQQSTVLANELLILINDIIAHNRTIVNDYSFISEPIFYSLSFLDQSQGSSELLLSILQFFTEIVFTLNDDQFNKFTTAIRTVYGNENHDMIFLKLVQFLAGDLLPTVNPSFVIRRPRAVLIFFYMYSKSIDTIEYLINLCKFSDGNCIACHEANLDLLILETIQSKWNDDSISKDYLEILFKLYSTISNGASSMQSIEKFISLLSPINGQYLSPHYQVATDALYDIIRVGLKIPLCQMPLKSEKVIKTTEIYSIELGFTFASWIYIDKSLANYNPVIFKAWNDKDWSITIALRSNIITFLELGSNYKISSNLDAQLPTREWLRLTLTYYVDRRSASLYLYINGIHITTLKTVLPDIIDWNFHFSFGGINESSIDDPKPSYLGPFAIFPLIDTNQVASIFNENQNSFSPIDKKPYFTYYPPKIQIFENETFYSLFVGKCCLNFILPIFTLSYLRYRNGERNKLFFESTVSIISNTLSAREETEKLFSDMEGFKIISHALSHSDPKYLTYHLYTRFFSIFQSLKNENLQAELFSFILVNFSIWIKSEEQNLILKHILRILLPSALQFSQEYFQFAYILNNILFFYTNKLQVELKRPTKLNLSACRLLFYQMLMLIVPSFEELHLLVSATYYFSSQEKFVNENEIIAELLELICEFAKVKKLTQFFTKDEIIILFKKLIPSCINKIPIPLVSFLFTLYKLSIVQISEFSKLIIINMKPSTASSELLLKLVEIVNDDAVDFFPILCLTGLQLNWSESNIFQMISTINLTSLNEWYIWPVIWALTTSKDGQCVIMNFLAKVEPSHWLSICDAIELVSKSLNMCSDDAMNCFLMQSSHLLMCNEISLSESAYKGYQKAIGRFLFYRSNDNFFEKINNFPDFENPKVNNETVKINLPSFKGKDNVEILKQLQLSMLYYAKESNYKHFGLRYNEKGQWLEFEVAKAFLFIHSKRKIWKNIDLFVLVSHFFTKAQNNNKGTDMTKFDEIPPEIVLTETQLEILSPHPEFDITIFVESFVKSNPFKFNGFHCFSNNPSNKNSKNSFYSCTNSSSDFIGGKNKSIHKNNLEDNNNNSNIANNNNNNNSNNEVFDNLYERSNFIFIKLLRSREKKWHKLWLKIWIDLTQEGRPWETAALKKAQMERDATLCSSCWCPFKILKTWRFDEQMATNIATEIVCGVEPCGVLHQSDQIDFIDKKDLLQFSFCKIIKICAPTEESKISVGMTAVVLERDKPRIMPISSIISMTQNSYQSRETATELTFNDGKSYFLSFPSKESRDSIFELIKEQISAYSPNKVLIVGSDQPVPQKIIENWKENRISNFKYIMLLNQISGCSFNVESQYPIFPRILNSYNDLKSIRDFGKPIDYKSMESPLFCLQRLEPFSKISEKKFYDINQISNNNIELTPEFYFSPEFLLSPTLADNYGVKLPEWATSAFDFIYKSRKILESEEVSQNLHKWIDQIWGEVTLDYCSYHPLFYSAHIQRSSKSESKEKVYMEQEVDAMQKINIDYKRKEKNSKSDFFINESQNWKAEFNEEHEIELTNTRTDCAHSMKFNFTNQITCSYISEDFHSIIIGMNDGTMLVHSLEHSSPVFVIHLEKCFPKSLNISPSWGFIITVTNDDQIIVFNINGILIKKSKLSFNSQSIISWASCDDFDFMAISDTNGNIYICEVYEASFGAPFLNIQNDIFEMFYDSTNDTLVVITEDGKKIIKSV